MSLGQPLMPSDRKSAWQKGPSWRELAHLSELHSYAQTGGVMPKQDMAGPATSSKTETINV